LAVHQLLGTFRQTVRFEDLCAETRPFHFTRRLVQLEEQDAGRARRLGAAALRAARVEDAETPTRGLYAHLLEGGFDALRAYTDASHLAGGQRT